jgi:hypothetical protein
VSGFCAEATAAVHSTRRQRDFPVRAVIVTEPKVERSNALLITFEPLDPKGTCMGES